MSSEIHHTGLYDENILLMYKGELTFDLISSIIATLEDRIEELETSRKLKKKFYGILTESIQNMYHHLETPQEEETIENTETRNVLVVLTAREKHYSLITGNYVTNHQSKKIQESIDRINNLSSEDLRSFYKELLNNNEFSEKGTAGLGFVDIARKTGQKLIYKFHPFDQSYSYFTFQVKLPRFK